MLDDINMIGSNWFWCMEENPSENVVRYIRTLARAISDRALNIIVVRIAEHNLRTRWKLWKMKTKVLDGVAMPFL